MLEASDLVQDGTTNLSTASFSTSAAQSKTTPLSNVAKRANTADLEESGILQDFQDASGVVARDDDADEDEPSNGEADPEEEREEPNL